MCATFLPNRVALRASENFARAEVDRIVTCRFVIDSTAREISQYVGKDPEPAEEVGSVGDRYRIWDFVNGVGLEVDFATDGRATLARRLPTEHED